MSHVIVGENRAIVMPDTESVEFTRARRAIAHPRAQIQEVTTDWHPEIGIHGALEVCVRAHLHGTDLLAGLPEGLDHPTGDGGGQGDQKIAMVAREVTGETEPDAVVKVLLSRVIRSPADLVRAYGIRMGDAVTLRVRQEIAAALGLVEWPSPDWASVGAWVYSAQRRQFARILSCEPDVSFHVGTVDSPPVPQGLIHYAWSPLVDAPLIWRRAKRDNVAGTAVAQIAWARLDAMAERTGDAVVSEDALALELE